MTRSELKERLELAVYELARRNDRRAFLKRERTSCASSGYGIELIATSEISTVFPTMEPSQLKSFSPNVSRP